MVLPLKIFVITFLHTKVLASLFLAPMVPMMLGTITVMEIATGFLSLAGIIYFFAAGSLSLIFYASVLGAASLTALFFGQRIAKDYAGAAVLIPYFLLLIVMMYLTKAAA